MLIILYIISFLIGSSNAAYCYETYVRCIMPEEYHKGPARIPTHFERIMIKKDNVVIGNIIPGGDIWDLYPHRIYGYIPHSQNMVKLGFKVSQSDNSGTYEFILVRSWRDWTILCTEVFAPNRDTIPVRKSAVKNPDFDIMEHENNFTCGNAHIYSDATMWNVIWKGSLIVMQTKSNSIDKQRINGFTKIYCETIHRCSVSNILKSNGRTEDLTWETDYRHTKTGFNEATMPKHYNTSVTDWYLTKTVPPRIRIYKDTYEIFVTTDHKNIKNIKNTGVDLVWIDDKLRFEFTDRALKCEFTIRRDDTDGSSAKFHQPIIIWVKYTPPPPR